MKNLLLPFAAIFLFSGCEYVYTYRFEITNRLPEPIEVHFSELGRDTIFSLPTDSTSILSEYEGGIESASGPHRPEGADIGFNLTVLQADGEAATTNFHNSDAWDFHEENSVGVSSIEIDSLDF